MLRSLVDQRPKIQCASVVFPLLTLNYSTTRRPGEDFIKIARVVIAVVQSQRTRGRGATGKKEKERPLKFTPPVSGGRRHLPSMARRYFFQSGTCKRRQVGRLGAL